MKNLFFFLTFLTLFPISGADLPPVKLLGHYMQWFHFRQENGTSRRFHWEHLGPGKTHNPDLFDSNRTHDIYSVLYPRIGVYDSLDPAVIDYHILSAKTTGISVFCVDWYGPDRQFELLLDRAEALDFQAAVCYEEKTCFPDWARNRAGIQNREDAIALAVKEFRYLKTLFLRNGYYKRAGKPVVMVFGFVYPRPKGWGENGEEWRFTPAEWRRILKESGCENVELLLQQFRYQEAGFNSFLWRHPGEFYPKGEALVKDKKIGFYVGTISPGFDDRGTNGWGQGGRTDPNLGLETLNEYLAFADQSSCDTFQVVTWNDFAEGTCVEPTFQYGQLYLERLGQWYAGRNQLKFESGCTILPYQYFVLRKKFGDSATRSICELLKKGEYAEARRLIETMSRERAFPIPRILDRENEFAQYRLDTPEAAASVPKVGKDKFLLVILAGQSNMSGRGTVMPADRKPDDRILMLNEAGVWVPAVDPVHFDSRNAGVGPARSFARKLAAAHPDAVIGLVPTAVGNSSLVHFERNAIHPGSRIRIYNDLIDRTRYAMAHGTPVALLFHHGESAMGPGDASVYGKNFTGLVARLRRDLGTPDLPVIVGEVRYRQGEEPNRLVNEGLRKFAAKDVRAAFVPTQDLTLSDGTHFDRASQLKLGERYFEQWCLASAKAVRPRAENNLATSQLKASGDAKSIEKWRVEVSKNSHVKFENVSEDELKIIPQNGRVVVQLTQPLKKQPTCRRMILQLRAAGSGIVRLHAIAKGWKKVANWGGKPFSSSPLLPLTRDMQTHSFEFEIPADGTPFSARIDFDTAVPVLLSQPELIVADAEQ